MLKCHFRNHPRDEACSRCGTRDGADSRRKENARHLSRRQRSFSDGADGLGNDRYRGGRGRPEGGRGRGDRSDGYREGHGRPLSPSPSRRESDAAKPYRSDRRQRGRDDPGAKKGDPYKEWPPSFESAGASYVFDARSGFFYEPSSNFFFDPKTKLYYGNKTQKYYQHYPDERPPFRAVSQPEQQQLMPMHSAGFAGSSPPSGTPGISPVEANSVSSVTNAAAPDTVGQPAGGTNVTPAPKSDKKKIAICIKRKTFSASGQKELTTAAAAADSNSNQKANSVSSGTEKEAKKAKIKSAIKEHEADMAKWSQRGKEARSTGDAIVDSTSVPAGLKTQQGSEHTTNQPQAGKKTMTDAAVKKTSTGKPICLLCKRKFANMDKLRQHEKVSALHKTNLQKKLAMENAGEASKKSQLQPSVQYRDRAQMRRVLYEPDNTEVSSSRPQEQDLAVDAAPSLEKARTVTATEVVRPEDSLGHANVGNKMLQNLGWKAGNALGRKQQPPLSGSSGVVAGVQVTLQKDWERIESIAGGVNGRGATGKGVGGF